MKFKMRIIHYSPAGHAETIANAIARAQEANSDKIPPAYPVENERLLFIGVEMKGSSVDKTVKAFCSDLRPDRVKNVAFYVVGGGNFAAIDELKQTVAAKNINVIPDVCESVVKSGLFSKGNLTDDMVKNAVAWADKIVNSLAAQ